MRNFDEFDQVQTLLATGMNDCAIARATGIPRTTVRDWRRRPGVWRRQAACDSTCGVDHDFAALPPAEYSYLLGLYLGDGCISDALRGVWRLRITLDKKYPAIIDRCREAIGAVIPGKQAGVIQRKGCVEVYVCSKHWPCLFPQHGPGKKHTRTIALQPWQQAVVNQATEEFVLGLIHSDGCRVVANDRGVMSVRYHFTNLSEDIVNLFTGALDQLGIHWRRSSKKQLSIYRKADTARLDEFIGPKSRPVPWPCIQPRAS
ncbi:MULTISPECIES: helix-turn-helix domain-containing protein [unclassified Mycobacterium]|uniref:helix-turn-helix domain-containing protein n=1 Tax=unclassified Mycobacterium TaxID=2642494 RepID=UPI00048BCDB0|nr:MULTISPECIES: helix-turn-helix domain-containing protein [unclassified Mycobacterium]SEB01329.1 hypothetical protein SAMN04488580_10637 [Mycobacterium sp. 283mftsu]